MTAPLRGYRVRMRLTRPFRCAYCHEIATTMDHVVPKSCSGQLGNLFNRDVTVPCCNTCNVLLGTYSRSEVHVRAGYLVDRYRTKYAKVLRFPSWSDEELEEMGTRLRTEILRRRAQKESLLKKLKTLEDVRCSPVLIEDVWQEEERRLKSLEADNV